MRPLTTSPFGPMALTEPDPRACGTGHPMAEFPPVGAGHPRVWAPLWAQNLLP